MLENKFKELVIIGGGPAGASAMLYSERDLIESQWFTGDHIIEGQLQLTYDVNNYLGSIPDTIQTSSVVASSSQTQASNPTNTAGVEGFSDQIETSQVETTDPVDFVDPIVITNPATSVDPIIITESIQPTDAVQSTDVVQSTDAVQSTDPIRITRSSGISFERQIQNLINIDINSNFAANQIKLAKFRELKILCEKILNKVFNTNFINFPKFKQQEEIKKVTERILSTIYFS